MNNNDIENPHAQTNNPGFDQRNIESRHKQSISERVSSGVQNWKQNSDFRMKICTTCPHYAAPRCKLCGCFMIAKTKIPQAKCPAGKW